MLPPNDKHYRDAEAYVTLCEEEAFDRAVLLWQRMDAPARLLTEKLYKQMVDRKHGQQN